MLDPDVVLRSDGGPGRPPLSTVVRGAAAVAGAGAHVRPTSARTSARRSSTARRASSSRRTAGPFSVMGFTVAGGRIVAIDVLADPDRLRELDLAVLDEG